MTVDKKNRVPGQASAKSVVWPGDQVRARFAVVHPQSCDGGVRDRCECERWERECAEQLAAANGWRVYRGRWPKQFAGHDFIRDVLPLVDHPVLFCEPGSRRVIAILSLDYNPRRDFSALGDAVVVTRLPQSWYFRGGVGATTAYLLQPAPTA